MREVSTNNFTTLNRAVSIETDRYRTQLRLTLKPSEFCSALPWYYLHRRALGISIKGDGSLEIRYVDRVVTMWTRQVSVRLLVKI